MKIQQFEAQTVSAALKKVREILGPGARVLKTETAPGGVLLTAGLPETGSRISVTDEGRKKDKNLASSLREIREEMSELREALAAGNPEGRISFAGLPGAEDLERRLRGNGIGPRLRRKVVELAASRGAGVELLGAAAQAIEDLVPIWSPANATNRPKVLAFVGPTGAGKTTTIAKLAGKLVHEAKKKIALVTLDTYRVGAVEQLRAYADMLGCPLEVGFTPADAHRALEAHRACDVVLVDTTGRSPFDGARIRELAGFLGAESVESLLVIAASTSPDVAEETIERFAVTTPTGVVLTKLDETRRPGNLLQLLIEEQLPIAYLATGQEVPADLERATPERVSLRLLADPEIAPISNLEAGL